MSSTDRPPVVPPPAAPSTVHAPQLHPEAHDADPPRRGLFRAGIGALFGMVTWVILLPFRWGKRRGSVDQITVYSAHPGFYLWLLILVGFAVGAVVRRAPGNGDVAEIAAWVYIWTMVYFIVTVLYDISTRKFLLWVGIVLLLWLGSKYIEHEKQIFLITYLFDYMRGLQPRLDPGTVTVVSWLLLIPWIGALGDMVLNGRKRFTPNEIGEFHFGEGSELTDRTGLRFRTRYRDVLETILGFGGGDILAVDNHQNEIKRYPNIIGLFFLWKRLDRILHQRVMVEDDEKDEK